MATTHTKRTARGVVTADAADHERRYVATRRLKWGGGWIEPGQEVPQEQGRNYASLVRHGEIAPFVPAPTERKGR
jgi:hypothetical protein